jgi:PKD repeat protein
MRLYQYISAILVLTLCFATSCDDDETPPQAGAAFTVSKTTVEVGEELQFTNASENATAFKWSFGDGTTSKEVAPKKIYSEGGTYLVTLVSTGAGGSSLSTATITVVPDEIYYINDDDLKISRIILDATKAEDDLLGLDGRSGVSLAYDPKTDRIYYSDFESYYESKIWSMKPDGSDAKVIVDGLYNAYQIAVDTEAGKVYWADDSDSEGDYIGHVGRANLDGSDIELLVSKEEASFSGVALDPENNKMYYYDVNNEVLFMSELDGSNEEVLLDDVYGYSLAVDTVHDKLYFENQNSPGLFSANLDGSNVTLVSDTDSRIYGIIIDYKHNKLLWTERDNGTLNRANLDGFNKEILKTGVGNIRGLAIRN